MRRVMVYQQCMRCGRILKPGALKYLVSIRVVADFDGIINEGEGDTDEMISQVLQQIEGMDAEELERDVYDELNLILCKGCKDHFVRNPFNVSEDDFSSLDPDATAPIH
jgi:hypothetical protein